MGKSKSTSYIDPKYPLLDNYAAHHVGFLSCQGDVMNIKVSKVQDCSPFRWTAKNSITAEIFDLELPTI
jgi:hypothetical protein